MPTLADVMRQHGPQYRSHYGARMLPSHARAISDIIRCRTAALGGELSVCISCGKEHLVYHSCGNRTCSQCGQRATQRWLQRQRELLLPVRYYHVVFTLPAELRRVVRTHQQTLISVLFRAAFAALAELCLRERWLGAHIGALAVLHTWTRTLEWHPHVHMLAPAGGLAEDGRTWMEPRKRNVPFLVPVKLLSGCFREHFIAQATKALVKLGTALPAVPAKKRWITFCKPTMQGAERVLEYLGRYVHRTALSDKAIVYCDEHVVRFRYRDSGTHERKEMTLPGPEFLRRFLQHVPMKGMHRVRAFGLLHPKHRVELKRVQLMLGGPPAAPAQPEPTGESCKPRTCPACKTGQLGMPRRLTAEQCAQRAAMAPPPPASPPPLSRPTSVSTPTARAPPQSPEERRCA